MIVLDPAKTDICIVKTDVQTDFDFERIYHRYWERVYGLAYYRLQSKHLAENIVQDVFTSLWSRQSNTKNAPIRHIPAWLASATKYAILRQMTLFQKQKTEGLDKIREPSTSDSIDLLFVDKMIATEINRLPRKCKLVFQYSRENNLPNKEIARQLSLSEKTVEKHITTALRKLRGRMKDFFVS